MTTSPPLRILTILVLLELCALAALWALAARDGVDSHPQLTVQLPEACPGTARVRPRELQAVNRAVDAWLDLHLRGQSLGPRSTAALISVEQQVRVEWNLARAGRLAGQAHSEETAALKRGQDRLLRSAGQIMAPALARDFERELSAAWEGAWAEHGPTSPRTPGGWSGRALTWDEGADQDAIWLGHALCLIAHGVEQDDLSRTRAEATRAAGTVGRQAGLSADQGATLEGLAEAVTERLAIIGLLHTSAVMPRGVAQRRVAQERQRCQGAAVQLLPDDQAEAFTAALFTSWERAWGELASR